MILEIGYRLPCDDHKVNLRNCWAPRPPKSIPPRKPHYFIGNTAVSVVTNHCAPVPTSACQQRNHRYSIVSSRGHPENLAYFIGESDDSGNRVLVTLRRSQGYPWELLGASATQKHPTSETSLFHREYCCFPFSPTKVPVPTSACQQRNDRYTIVSSRGHPENLRIS